MTGRTHKILAALGLYATGLAVVAGAGAGVVALSNRSEARADPSQRQAEVRAGPSVSVVRVGHSNPERTRLLLGEAHPYASTTLYAKVSGYLREIRVDRGDHVTEGQLLAVLDSPELETQVRAAQVDAENRQVLARRARHLAEPGIVSEQDAQTAEASAKVATAQVHAAQVQRDYRMLRAPFAGVVTARYADPGALLQSATGSQTSALPVVRVAQVDRLRVFIYLDQIDAGLVHLGDAVEVALPDRPETRAVAKISRVSGELDPKTRTMLAEVDVDNAQGLFPPGAFLRVSVHFRAPVRSEIPPEALLVRGAKTFVALIGPDDRVKMQPVTVLQHDGDRVQILGVQEGERVAVALGDSADDGQRVQPVNLPTPATRGSP
jgi:RND family efflux transporter MFP subunit